VGNSFISDVLVGWIPSPFSGQERWPIVQWRSAEGFGCPTNSIVLYYDETEGKCLWVADGWISDPRENIFTEFAAEFKLAKTPIFNGHTRELASLLATQLIAAGVIDDIFSIPSPDDPPPPYSPSHREVVRDNWRKAVVNYPASYVDQKSVPITPRNQR
jgi:hypothetical protein